MISTAHFNQSLAQDEGSPLFIKQTTPGGITAGPINGLGCLHG
jgi:hypothetical protein